MERDFSDLNLPELENKVIAPEEYIALLSFSLIQKKQFQELGEILSEDVVFKDAHFGPDPIQGRKEVVEALGYGFGNVSSISFHISSFGTIKSTEVEDTGNYVPVVVFTTTTTTESLLDGKEVTNSIGQMFYFEVKDGDNVNPKLDHIEAFQQYPPPAE